MRIVFIDPTSTIINFGLRVLANYLTNKGHEVKLIFMAQQFIDFDYNYPIAVYQDLDDIIKNSDIVGISFLSNYLGQAIKLTSYIKHKYSIPVIWGNVHATAMPEESLDYADLICIGEGEESISELLNRMSFNQDYSNIPGIWMKNKQNNDIIKNEVAYLNSNPDIFPIPLYDEKKEYLLQNERIIKLNQNLYKEKFKVNDNYYRTKNENDYSYLTLTSRGCPFRCTYCCNNMYHNLYKNKGKYLRTRSTVAVIDELKVAINKFPFITIIEFFDDDFIMSRAKDLKEFCDLYKKEINLPFRCCVTPVNLTREALAILVDAGLITVEMGLQTASQKVNSEIYKRKFDKQKFLESAYILNEFPTVTPHYDVILDNPLESTKDVSETLRFITELPYPYFITHFSLTFFPGSELYKFAIERNLLIDNKKQVYNYRNNTIQYFKNPYIKTLLTFIKITKRMNIFPKNIFHFLSNNKIISILNSRFFFFFWVSILFLKLKLSDIKNGK